MTSQRMTTIGQEITRKLGPPEEKGTHHKPTTTTEREVAPVEPKRHTEDSSTCKADKLIRYMHG
ncbi:hypothetical protein A2U01_0085986, partial [Trifolium medium]|nr:hypothetical protein [Trifolium medium]